VTGPNVSRETSPRLAAFADLLTRWNKRINLVSRGDLDRLWPRHIADSAQLFGLAPPRAATWLDIGSGAGFPGLVCAILAADAGRPCRFTLVEAHARKAAFLREATRKLALPAEIRAERIETVPPTAFDVVSARALARLPRLLTLAHPFCGPNTVCLFPKGVRVESELTDAAAGWHTRVERLPDRIDSGASILRITDIAPRP